MSRLVSFIMLVAVLVAIAALFFVVMSGFVLPLFIALLLVVMFQPLHEWFILKCKDRVRLAAALTTAAIGLIVLLPLLAIFAEGLREGLIIHKEIKSRQPIRTRVPTEAPQGTIALGELDSDASREQQPLATAFLDSQMLADAVVRTVRQFGLELSEPDVEATIRKELKELDEWIGPFAIGTAKFSGNLILGLAITVIATYFFLADGPWMVRKVMKLSPLDDRYEEQLFQQFVQISRAMVVATLLSALVQGLLAGLGFYLAGIRIVFLLTVLTMFLAMIPFVGAAAVWIPTSLWLFFFANRPMAGVFLAVYGAGIVSMADNVIKPLVLHGRSKMHPLLALLSVIGGVRVLGPIGIFVGPMVVVFFHAVLNMFNTELDRLSPRDSGEGNAPEQDVSEAQEATSRTEQSSGSEPSAETAQTPVPTKKAKKSRRRGRRR